jgi:hypothetical protein
MAEDERKTALIAELTRTRGQISGNVRALGHYLDFATRARRSFARNPAIWIGSTALLGLLVARLLFGKKQAVPTRTRKTQEAEIEKVGKAGLALAALKIAFNIARPVLIPWATRLFAEYFSPEKERGYPPR